MRCGTRPSVTAPLRRLRSAHRGRGARARTHRLRRGQAARIERRRARGGQARRHAHRPVGRRHGQHRPGHHVLPGRLQIVRATQKTLFTPRSTTRASSSPTSRRPPRDRRRRLPRHGDAQARRLLLAAGRPEVTSADVKYAIERGFFGSVNNGYAGVYFGGLRGAGAGADPGTRIPGIMTPDDHTIVFALERPDGVGPLRRRHPRRRAGPCPCRRPSRESIAKRFDAKPSSTYGAHQVATGPYMVENDDSGRRSGTSRAAHPARPQPQLERADSTPARPTSTRSRSARATTTRR